MKIPGKATILISCLIIAFHIDAQSTNDYKASVDTWHKEREDALKKENGWLNLVGLHWLKPGRNSFGTDAANDIIFPKGTIASHAGYFYLNEDNSVTLVTDPGVSIFANREPITTRIIFHKDSTRVPTIASGRLRWTIIKRDEKIGIRLRDLQSPELLAFHGIERFPVEEKWKVDAVVEQKGFPDRISITNVLGQTNLQKAAGRLLFSINGKNYSLDALDEGGPDLFIIFGDSTNRSDTYPSGRFLSVKRPDASGKTVIDFNKSYNPPCAFTDFATCPLPPPQNRLDLAIPAGEKKYGSH